MFLLLTTTSKIITRNPIAIVLVLLSEIKICFAKYLKVEDAECGWPRIFYINYSDRNDNVYDRYLESSTK